MRQLFKIDESEKKRILEMHENATKNLYLSEQGTPPQAASPAATGTQIEGKTYKVEKIKDKDSLNSFINWGTPRTDGEVTSDTRKFNVSMANQLGYAYQGNELPEKPGADVDSEPVKKIKQVYADLDLIAQNYTLAQVCKGTFPKQEGGQQPNLSQSAEFSKTIAKNRAVSLGWCVGMG